MSEQKNEELLDTTEKEHIAVEKKEESKEGGQFTSLSLTLMIIIVLGILATGCWYTYYQYNRFKEINSAPK